MQELKEGIGVLVALGEEESLLPLESLHIRAKITSPLAEVTVRQTFHNPYTQPIEARYMFPLPHDAAISRFEMRIGQRKVKGELMEIGEATKKYTLAKETGIRTTLLEEERPNLI